MRNLGLNHFFFNFADANFLINLFWCFKGYYPGETINVWTDLDLRKMLNSGQFTDHATSGYEILTFYSGFAA